MLQGLTLDARTHSGWAPLVFGVVLGGISTYAHKIFHVPLPEPHMQKLYPP